MTLGHAYRECQALLGAGFSCLTTIECRFREREPADGLSLPDCADERSTVDLTAPVAREEPQISRRTAGGQVSGSRWRAHFRASQSLTAIPLKPLRPGRHQEGSPATPSPLEREEPRPLPLCPALSSPSRPPSDSAFQTAVYRRAALAVAGSPGHSPPLPAISHMVAHTVLLLCLAALAAAQPALEPNSVIVSLARDTFSVQSADGAAAADAAGDLGQPIGPHLRRVPLQPGESVQDAVARLAAMPGKHAGRWGRLPGFAHCRRRAPPAPAPAALPHLTRPTHAPSTSLLHPFLGPCQQTGVEAAYPDHPVWAESIKPLTPAPAGGVFPGLPDNRGLKLQWGALRIGMPDAWQLAKGGASRDKAVTVCVVDSGVDYK